MSKKGTTNQVAKKEQEIVDQQKDPMLRALQKKVRNINKKLTEIAELSLKKDLKPEQEQKVSKKGQILQQKEKYTEMIEIYKDIAADSEKLIRKAQLVELEDLASLIAIKQYGSDLGAQFNQSIDNLVKILTTSSNNEQTLQARVQEISTALVASANNSKLKKTAKQFVEKNPDNKRVNFEAVSNEPEPISPQSEKQREEQIKQLQHEQQLQKKQNEANEPLTPQVLTQHTPAPVSQPSPASEVPPVVAQVNPTKQAEPEEKKEVNPTPAQTAPKDENDKKPYSRNYQGNRRGGREGKDGRNYEERKYNKKPNFKPKYEEQKDQKVREPSSSSSSRSNSEPKARQFKREEVRELIEDGFIVVGKPKLKAREQKQFHDHEHGNKHHRHHTKKNY